MAEKIYTLKEAKELEKLEVKSVEEQEVQKEKVSSAEVAETKYTLSSVETSVLKEKDRVVTAQFQEVTDFKDVVLIQELVTNGVTQEVLTELEIYLPAETTTVEDVKAILEKREVIAATKIVNFDLSYRIEAIPRPDVNKMYSLTMLEKNVFDVPVWKANVDTNKLEEHHVLKNFIRQIGGTYNLVVSGVAGTHFEVIIVNETDGTYYNWNTISETRVDAKTQEESINTQTGSFQLGVSYYQGIIPTVGREIISIHIPAVSSETVYRLGFVPSNERNLSTDYGDLPMIWDETRPMYKITQLMRSSTTIGFENSQLLGQGTGDLVINHNPGSKLDSSNATKGKYDVELRISPRKEIALAPRMLNGIVDLSSFEIASDATEILDIDLSASISDNVGTIKGTITLGKSSLRPSLLSIRASDVFSIDQSNI